MTLSFAALNMNERRKKVLFPVQLLKRCDLCTFCVDPECVLSKAVT